jgi:RNA polymerase primary sigma factor
MPDHFLVYLEHINATARLTAEEEAQLATAIRAGDQMALDKLVRASLRFVPPLTAEYAGRGVTEPDLVDAGNLGLIHAAYSYNGRDDRFAAFSRPYIRAAMEKAVVEATAVPPRVGPTATLFLVGDDLV